VRAGSGQQTPGSLATSYTTDDNGKPLRWTHTRQLPDRDLWVIADDEEIIRLIDETKTMLFFFVIEYMT
jgi:hypothetical protein